MIKSSLFIASNPVLIVLLSGLFLKEKITKNHIIGMAVALTGVVFIITDGHLLKLFQYGFEPIDFVLLGAVVSWAIYSVVGKVVLKNSAQWSPLLMQLPMEPYFYCHSLLLKHRGWISSKPA